MTHPPKTSGSPVTGMATAPRPADDDACDRADGEHPSASGSVANEMLLSGARNKIDAFMAWGWDYFSKDRATAIAPTPAASSGEMTTKENNLSSTPIGVNHNQFELPESPAQGEDSSCHAP